jgi:hypothetical protein
LPGKPPHGDFFRQCEMKKRNLHLKEPVPGLGAQVARETGSSTPNKRHSVMYLLYVKSLISYGRSYANATSNIKRDNRADSFSKRRIHPI